MSCVQALKGISKGCENSIGGIKAIWMAPSSEISAPTSVSGSENLYTLTQDDVNKFKAYETDRYTSSFTSTFTSSDNGGKYWTNELSVQFRRMTPEKSAEIDRLALSSLAVVVLDNNGQYWFISEVEMNGGTAQTGQAMDDLNGYAPTFSGSALELPLALSEFSPAPPTGSTD